MLVNARPAWVPVLLKRNVPRVAAGMFPIVVFLCAKKGGECVYVPETVGECSGKFDQ